MAMLSLQTIRDLERVYDIASIAIRYGFADVVQRLDLTGALEPAGRILRWSEAEELVRLSPPERVRRMMEELGPTFIKLGQILATRVDLFAPEWISQFERLQSHVPPVPFPAVREQLREDLGAEPDTVFQELQETPLGAASIAQVHEARLTDGTPVILKVRRPGIRPVVEADLRLLAQLAELAEERLPQLARYRLRDTVAAFAHSLQGELDLAQEGRNAERAAENLKDIPILSVPRVYWTYTGERLNVQELIRGIPGSDLDAAQRAGLDCPRIAREGARAIARMVLKDGFFHADPHPGNLVFLPDNRTVLLDFGMVGRLSRSRREQLLDLLYGMVLKDATRVTDILLNWSFDDNVNPERLSSDVETFIDRYHSVALAKIDFAMMFGELTRLIRDNQLSLPADLALTIKVFITLEGLGRRLDPDFDLATEAGPLLKELMFQRYSPRRLLKTSQQTAGELADLLKDLPRDLKQLMRFLRSGSLDHRLEIVQLERFAERIDRAASRLAVSLVTAAFIIGTSVVVAVGDRVEVLGLPLMEILGIGAIIGGLWVLVSIWRGS